MTFDKMIEQIMSDVQSGSDKPFMIFRDKYGGWMYDYTQDQYGMRHKWTNGMKDLEPLALELRGKDLSGGSYATVYDDILCRRIREEYDLFRSFGHETDNYSAITCFFEDHVGSFSQEVMTYLTTIERPLAALQEMIPFDMTTRQADWFYNEDLADNAISHIEKSVGERTHVNINKSPIAKHDNGINTITNDIYKQDN